MIHDYKHLLICFAHLLTAIVKLRGADGTKVVVVNNSVDEATESRHQ